jgi:Cu-Zn family superoxide dismutase
VKFQSRFLAATVLAIAAVAAPVVVSADMAAAEMIDTDGAVIGKATFEQTPHGVLMNVEVAGLPPGAHGIHLHAVGACAPDFKAATGHINPNGVPHGLRHPDGPDHGDLPNLFVAADGSARAEFFTVLVSVAGGDMPALLDEDGSAVIIHENPDDHLTQPIGGAGGRISCGVIEAM